MRSLIRKFIDGTVEQEPFWNLYQSIGRLTHQRSYIYRYASKTRAEKKLIVALFSDLTVKHGPFQGMRYVSAAAVGSLLLPKLLGSYEQELHPVIREILAKDYSDIVDIGCAEGYYAVGLAMRLPKARVQAFDTDPRGQALCREMAELNGVTDRVVVKGFLSAENLKAMRFGGTALIISDCEGYEKQLFTKDVARSLARHELLIEVHDVLDIEISGILRENFAATHDIRSIESVDDLKKVRTYAFEELSGCSPQEKLAVLAEKRGALMEWFYLTPKR
jgi:hypothetical protein